MGVYLYTGTPGPSRGKTWDFTDGTWDSTKLNSEFDYVAPGVTYQFTNDGLTSTATGIIGYTATSNGSQYHKITMEIDCFQPGHGLWFAQTGGIAKTWNTYIEGMNSNAVWIRSADVQPGYCEKTMGRLGRTDSAAAQLIKIQLDLAGQFYTKKMVYDWSNGDWEFYVNDDLKGSGTDSDYTNVATAMANDIIVYCDLENGSYNYGVAVKSISYTLE